MTTKLFARILLLSLGIGLLNACQEPEEPPQTETPELSISSLTFFEGNENQIVRFKVNTSLAHTQEVKVEYTTEEITAGEDIDFIPAAGTLSIPAGEREGIIEVEIVADTLREGDEAFQVVLSNPVQATIRTGTGVATIRNDDTFLDIPDDGYSTPSSYVGYTLVWQDEFEGTEIDANNWTHELGNSGWGNNELQNYTAEPENSFISDGALVIEAREESSNGSNYSSARMITQGKQEYMFGRIDIRAKLPEGQGIWPALWMLGSNFGTVGWPACGELDIMELVGHEPSTTHGTAHWGPQGQGFSNLSGGSKTLDNGKFSDEFHVFSLIWEFDRVRWLLDDVQLHEINKSTVGNNQYPFNQPFFFIFNIAVGGNWPGSPDATTTFPQRMVVDFVRVFQED